LEGGGVIKNCARRGAAEAGERVQKKGALSLIDMSLSRLSSIKIMGATQEILFLFVLLKQCSLYFLPREAAFSLSFSTSV